MDRNIYTPIAAEDVRVDDYIFGTIRNSRVIEIEDLTDSSHPIVITSALVYPGGELGPARHSRWARHDVLHRVNPVFGANPVV